MFPEDPAEMVRIVKTAPQGDFPDVQAGTPEQFNGQFQPELSPVFLRGAAGHFPERTEECAARRFGFFHEGIDIDGFREVPVHVFDHLADTEHCPVGLMRFGGGAGDAGHDFHKHRQTQIKVAGPCAFQFLIQLPDRLREFGKLMFGEHCRRMAQLFLVENSAGRRENAFKKRQFVSIQNRHGEFAVIVSEIDDSEIRSPVVSMCHTRMQNQQIAFPDRAGAAADDMFRLSAQDQHKFRECVGVEPLFGMIRGDLFYIKRDPVQPSVIREIRRVQRKHEKSPFFDVWHEYTVKRHFFQVILSGFML